MNIFAFRANQNMTARPRFDLATSCASIPQPLSHHRGLKMLFLKSTLEYRASLNVVLFSYIPKVLQVRLFHSEVYLTDYLAVNQIITKQSCELLLLKEACLSSQNETIPCGIIRRSRDNASKYKTRQQTNYYSYVLAWLS